MSKSSSSSGSKSGSKKAAGSGNAASSWLASSLGNKWVRRTGLTVALLGATAYALQGGEYSTTDLVAQRHQRDSLAAQVKVLQDSVSVLQEQIKAVATDPERLERIAREEYGMVKGDREILYR